MTEAAMWNPGASYGSWGYYLDTDWTGTINDVQSLSTMYKPNLSMTFFIK